MYFFIRPIDYLLSHPVIGYNSLFIGSEADHTFGNVKTIEAKK